MSETPVEQLLDALDRLDLEAAMALMAAACTFTTADGRCAEGEAEVRELVTEFLGMLRSMSHRITAQWHPEDVWIAEVEATYVLQDWLEIRDRRRAFFVRAGAAGITDARVYGAHESRLSDHLASAGGVRVAGRWIPPL